MGKSGVQNMEINKTKFWLKESIALFDKHYALSSLILFVTNKCNGKCIGCLYWSKLNKNNCEDLTIKEIRKVSDSIGNTWWLQISGGEPFLCQDLPDICKTFVENNHTKLITIPTNGILTDKIIKTTERILSTCNCYLNISVSIDGTQQLDCKLRGVKDGFKKSFITLTALNKLSKKFPNLTFDVSTRITNINLEDIPLLRQKVSEIDPAINHNIFPIRGKLKEKWITPPKNKEYYSLITSLNKKIGLINKVKYTLVGRALEGNEWPFDCVAGRRIGVIDSDGDVRLCELLSPIGNLRKIDYNFHSVWNSEKAEKQRELIKSRKCSAGCTHGCFLWPSLLNHPWKIATLLFKSRILSP